MRTPRLRETVTLYVPTDGDQTDWGAPDGGEYTEVGTRRAKVEEDGGDLARRAGADEERQRVTLKMRQWDEVVPDARFEWRGKTLQVEGVKALDQERRWMEVTAYVESFDSS